MALHGLQKEHVYSMRPETRKENVPLFNLSWKLAVGQLKFPPYAIHK